MSYFSESNTIIKNVYFLGSSCCAMELENLFTVKYDAERIGFKRTHRIDNADVIMIGGFIPWKTLSIVLEELDHRIERPSIIAVGGCPIKQGPLNCNNLDIPIDIFVPGCPPRPESLLDALHRGLKLI